MMNWVLDRLKEPSSAAGVGLVIAGLIQVGGDKGNAEAWTMVVSGLVAIVRRERGA